MCYPYDYRFIIKDINQDQANKKAQGKVWEGPEYRAPCSQPVESGYTIPLAHWYIHQPESSTKPQCSEVLLGTHYEGMVEWIMGYMIECNP